MDTSIAMFRSSNGWVIVDDILRFMQEGVVKFTGRLARDENRRVETYVAYLHDLQIVHSHA